MKVKSLGYYMLALIFLFSTSCQSNNNNVNKSNISEETTIHYLYEDNEDNNTNIKETPKPYIGRMNIDDETAKFIYGNWKIEKLLDAGKKWANPSDYPKIIGDEIIIQKDLFSSKGLKNYEIYQVEFDKPVYEISTITYNALDLYRISKIDFKLFGIEQYDIVKFIDVSSITKDFALLHFLNVNNNRLILGVDGTSYELTKI